LDINNATKNSRTDKNVTYAEIDKNLQSLIDKD
jgi:hypothetical protein